MNQAGIDLWRFPLDVGPETVNAALAVLCSDERAHFRQFENSRFAAAYAIRRACRRIILARYLEIEPLEVKVCDTQYGKPELPGQSMKLHFSASHSKDLGILAVSRQYPVGADIECTRPIDVNTLAARIFTPSERLEFDGMETDARNAIMLRAWVAKEALIKGIGIGLDLRDLPLIEISLTPAPEVWKRVNFAGRMRRHGQWYVCTMAPMEGYIISIAASSEATVTVINMQSLIDE